MQKFYKTHAISELLQELLQNLTKYFILATNADISLKEKNNILHHNRIISHYE